MKILRIRFKNINSLKGTHEVDFTKDPLAAAGLFAITGVTGSGKTTILDVITLALYNRIPRMDVKISKSAIEKAGIIITRNMRDAFAEVVYSTGEERNYSSKWSISYTRNDTIGEYAMEIADAETGVLLDVKRKDIPEKNAELIGLNYEQFVRAIILAQGDFATFLKSKKDERGKLLEQITGGEIYRELGQMAYEMNKKHGQELEDKKLLMKNIEERLLNEEEYRELGNQLKRLNTDIKLYSEEKEKLGSAIKLKQEIEQGEIQTKKLTAEKQVLDSRLRSFSENDGKKLDKHLALAPVQEHLLDWRRENKNKIELREKSDRIKKSIVDFKNKIQDIRDRIASLTSDKDREPMEALSSLEEKVVKLDGDISIEGVKFQERIITAEQLARELLIPFSKDELSEFGDKLNKEGNEHNAELENLSNKIGPENLKDPNSTIISCRAALISIGDILNEQEFLDLHQEELKKNKDDAVQVDFRLKSLPAEIQKKEKELEVLNLKHKLLKKDFDLMKLQASLEDHRKNLKDGEACPLCGALEHPLAVHEDFKPNELSSKIAELDKTIKGKNGDLISMQHQLKEFQERQTKLLSKKSEIEKNLKLRATKRDFLLKELPETYRKSEMSVARQMLEQDIEYIEQYNKHLVAIEKLANLKNQTTQLIKIETEITHFIKKRNALYSGENFSGTVKEIRELWTLSHNNLKNNSDQLTEVSKELITVETKVAALFKEIAPLIKKLGYEDISMVFNDLLPREAADKLHNEKRSINNLIRDNQTETRVSQDNLSLLKESDSGKTKEELRINAEENEAKLSGLNESKVTLLTKKQLQEDNISELEKLNILIKTLSQKNEKWNLLNKYIGDAEGKKFSTFAQQLTLFKLINLANNRLKMLDDRYLLAMPTKEDDDSLSVIDMHMGDLRRSVKSLSGGETFIISLALALALSDLASQQVNLESLFIDEGFGSLDKLTLDQTIDTLEKLQYESGKNIGVISHVEAMQERITTQIQVSKNGQGYSSLQIV